MDCRPDTGRIQRVGHDPGVALFSDPEKRIQVALTLAGALFFASALVVVIGPLDPFSPQQAAVGTDDEQLSNGSSVEADTPALTEDGTQKTTATQTPDDGTTSDDEATGGDDGGGDQPTPTTTTEPKRTEEEADDGASGDGETSDDENGDQQDRAFQELGEERQELQNDHERLEREHRRLEGNESTDEEWKEHRREYEKHREEFRDHRERFEKYVDQYGESARTLDHRQWLRKRGTEHTIHSFNSDD